MKDYRSDEEILFSEFEGMEVIPLIEDKLYGLQTFMTVEKESEAYCRYNCFRAIGNLSDTNEPYKVEFLFLVWMKFDGTHHITFGDKDGYLCSDGEGVVELAKTMALANNYAIDFMKKSNSNWMEYPKYIALNGSTKDAYEFTDLSVLYEILKDTEIHEGPET